MSNFVKPENIQSIQHGSQQHITTEEYCSFIRPYRRPVLTGNRGEIQPICMVEPVELSSAIVLHFVFLHF
jgi:hypothetical protein